MKKVIALCFVVILCLSFGSVNLVFAKEDLSENALKTGAKSVYLMSADCGDVIYSYNEDLRLPIASMTKIMLLNLVFEAVEGGKLSLNEDILVSENAQSMGGSQVFLQANKYYKCSDLVKSVIIASANDASVALAERLFVTEDNCVNEMNKKAKELGLSNTLFSNVTGLTKPTQYSCAKDVAKMTCYLTQFDDYFKFSNIYLDELTHPDGSKTTLINTNKLVRFYDGCDGGKTGFTNEAKFCLSATAKRNDMRLVCVCIGEESSKERFNDVSNLLNFGFNNFKQKLILDKNEVLTQSLKIKGSASETVEFKVENSVYGFEKRTENEDFTYNFEFYNDLVAPISCGEIIGNAVVYKNGVEISRTCLVLETNVEKFNFGTAFDKVLENW